MLAATQGCQRNRVRSTDEVPDHHYAATKLRPRLGASHPRSRRKRRTTECREAPRPRSTLAARPPFKRKAGAEPSLGWTPGAFVQTYEANQGTAITATLETSLIPTPLRAVLEKLHGRFDGRMSVLLGLLGKEVGDEVRRDSQWPKRPNVFSGELRRLAPAFRQIGIEITIAQTGKRRVSIQTEELGKRSDPSGPSGPTPCPDGSDGPGGPDDPGLFGTLSNEGGNGSAGENPPIFTSSGAQRCLRCGSTEFWHDGVAGDRCLTCDPPPGTLL